MAVAAAQDDVDHVGVELLEKVADLRIRIAIIRVAHVRSLPEECVRLFEDQQRPAAFRAIEEARERALELDLRAPEQLGGMHRKRPRGHRASFRVPADPQPAAALATRAASTVRLCSRPHPGPQATTVPGRVGIRPARVAGATIRAMELHVPSGRRALGAALASTTMLLWGVLPLALERLLATLDVETITSVRFLASAAVLACVLAIRGELPRVATLERGGWILLATAVGGLVLNYWGYLKGLDTTAPATAQVLIQLAPLLLALGGISLFGERFTMRQWASFGALCLGLAGFLVAQLVARPDLQSETWTGAGLLGVAAVAWAAYGLAQKQLLRSLSSQGIMLVVYAACGLLLLPGLVPGQLASLSAGDGLVLLFAAANTLIGYGAFAAALEHWEASRVSAVLALTPIATLAFTRLGAVYMPDFVAQERLSVGGLACAGLVVAGSAGVALFEGRRS